MTVNNGTLDYSGGTLPNCNYTITGGTLNIGSLIEVDRDVPDHRRHGHRRHRHTHQQHRLRHSGRHGRVILAGTGIALNKTGRERRSSPRSNTYTGTTTISAGTLQLGNGGSTGALSSTTSIVINSGGTFDVNRRRRHVTFSSKISGAGTLEKDGTGTLAMSGSNSFSGNLVVNNGTLNYSGNSTLPAGNYTVNGGTLNTGSLSKTIGTFQITGGTATGTGTLTAAAYDLQNGTVSVSLGGSAGVEQDDRRERCR